MAELRGMNGLQVFPEPNTGFAGISGKCLDFRPRSGLSPNPQPTPQEAPERRQSPAFCPGADLLPLMGQLRAALEYGEVARG